MKEKTTKFKNWQRSMNRNISKHNKKQEYKDDKRKVKSLKEKYRRFV